MALSTTTIQETEHSDRNRVPEVVELQLEPAPTPSQTPPRYKFKWVLSKTHGKDNGTKLKESENIVFACDNVVEVKEWDPSQGIYVIRGYLQIPEGSIEHKWNAFPTSQVNPDDYDSETGNNCVMFTFEIIEEQQMYASVANLSKLRQSVSVSYEGTGFSLNTGTYAFKQANWHFVLDGVTPDDPPPPEEM
jgi:hypothetical protein